MRVVAEFVDRRTGKRYFPGEGDKIKPELGPDQVERLTAAGCIATGAETKATKETALADLTVSELKDLAEKCKIDLGDATKKADIIAAIELASEAGAA